MNGKSLITRLIVFKMAEIKISEVFSEDPGLRHCSISDESGEEFYHKVLNDEFYKAFSSDEKLIVNLDGGSGYAPSFLDEAIGNLIYDFTLTNVKNYLTIISLEEPEWIEYLEKETYVQWENRRLKGEAPKKTESHQPWYRMVNEDLIKKNW